MTDDKPESTTELASAEAAHRIAAFKADLTSMKLTVGRPTTERRFELFGAAIMIIGIVLVVISYASSLKVKATVGSNIDVLDSNSDQVLAILGLAIAICGGVVYLRYALVRFLRVWLLRQLHDQQVTRRPGGVE
jgi:uncharacterized membrane protein YidH (DUF202 family)